MNKNDHGWDSLPPCEFNFTFNSPHDHVKCHLISPIKSQNSLSLNQLICEILCEYLKSSIEKGWIIVKHWNNVHFHGFEDMKVKT